MPSSMFLNEHLDGRPVMIIGSGSLGGPIFDHCIRKEVQEVHLFDPDIVDERNRFNQRVYDEDIGKLKVLVRDRIRLAINPLSKTKVVLHNELVGPDTELEGIVISAVDHMRKRYDQVWPAVYRQRDKISFFADGRVGIDGGKAYGLDPSNENHVYHYVGNPLHNHPQAELSEAELACKSDFPMPENADAVAAAVMWRLNRWLHLEQGCNDPYDNYVGWQWVPGHVTVCEQWDAGTASVMYKAEVAADWPMPALPD